MKTINISSEDKRQVIDITDQVTDSLPAGEGTVTVFARHTTLAITIIDLDPGTDLDFLDLLDELVPDKRWRHPHDPAHAPDHLLAGLVGPSVSVPFSEGQLLLGTWQRVVLVEFDGPRKRSIIVS